MKHTAPAVIQHQGTLPYSLISATEFAAGFDIPSALGDLSQEKTAVVDVCHDRAAVVHDASTHMRAIADGVAVLAHSPQARALLACAIDDAVTLGHAPLLPAGSGHYDPAHAHLGLGRCADTLCHSEKGMSLILTALVTTLRRHWHHSHAHAPDMCLRPADYATHARMLTADCLAMLHLVAWELRGAGHGYLWRALVAGDTADMAEAFEAAISADAQAQFDGRAIRAAFTQWFACRDRMNAADLDSLELYDAGLVRSQGRNAVQRVASRPLDRAQLQHLGLMADGQSYLEGCVFTNPWFDGFDSEESCAILRQIEAEVRQIHAFSA